MERLPDLGKNCLFLKEVPMSAARYLLCAVLVLSLQAPVVAQDLLLEDINFPFDSKIVVDDLKQTPKIAELLKTDPTLFLEIEGHCDALGTEAYNEGLSLERVQSVKKILVEKGVAPHRIAIKGYGEDRPKADNATKEGRFQNRRAVFSIYKMKDGKKDYLYKDNVLVKSFDRTQRPRKEVGLTPSRPETVALPYKEPRTPEEMRGETKVLRLGGHRAGLSVGAGSDDGDLTGTLDGRLFLPFHDRLAFQGGLRGNFNDTVAEGQLDAGMVGKHERFQVGLFGSLKLADLDGYDDPGSLSQLGLVASRLFDRGSVGLFLTEGLDDDDTIASDQRFVSSDLIVTETFLEVQDKYGINFDYIFEKGLCLGGNLGIVQAEDDEVTGSLKVGYPFMEGTQVFIQGSYNNGYLEDDDNYAVVVGIELGNWGFRKNGTKDLRPMQVPEISYALKTRSFVNKEATNKPPGQPVISAVPVSGRPFTVSFTGSAADPDGFIASYEWDFDDGTTGSGQTVTHTYTIPGIYNVRLTVADDLGATASLTQEQDVPLW
jgi:hypothetical protein